MSRRHQIIRTRGQRIAWTNTSRVPDPDLIAAIKFVAAEVSLDRTVVHMKRAGSSRTTYGRAYHDIPSVANLDGLDPWDWRYLIVATDHYDGNKKTDVIPLDGKIISTLAHEARHVEQFRTGTFRRARRERNAEAQCNAFGGWIAERWEAGR